MDGFISGITNLRVDTVLSAVDKYVPGAQNKIKNLADKAKAYVNNVSELEMKVLEATNHEPWGPHGSVMQEITQQSFNSEGFYQIMGVVDQRLSEGPDNWRLVYKTLLLLEYMLKHGPMAVAEALGSYSRISMLEKLRDKFDYKDPTGHDQGINVRQRAAALVILLNDRDKLVEERDKAAKNKSKYTGVSSSSMRYGGFSGGSSSYENSHSSSTSNYNRSTSSSSAYGSRGFGSSSTSSGIPAGEAADPVEATKQRIARLREQGAIAAAADGTSSSVGVDNNSSVGPGFEDPLSPGRKPKKLSEIKINPAIIATFAKGGLAPPPSAGSTGSTARATAGSTGGTASGIDLLGDLDVPAPAVSSAAAAAAPAADDWDRFSNAPAATTAAVPASAASGVGGAAADEWAAFDSAPAPAAPKGRHGPLDINALLGPIPATTPAASKGSTPLMLDDFCSAPVAQQAPAGVGISSSSFAAAPPAAAAAADPFGPFVTSPTGAAADPFASTGFSSFTSAPSAAAGGGSVGAAGGAGDPFAASGALHMMAQATNQHASTGPKLGPETAKAKDPFADLALI